MRDENNINFGQIFEFVGVLVVKGFGSQKQRVCIVFTKHRVNQHACVRALNEQRGMAEPRDAHVVIVQFNWFKFDGWENTARCSASIIDHVSSHCSKEGTA